MLYHCPMSSLLHISKGMNPSLTPPQSEAYGLVSHTLGHSLSESFIKSLHTHPSCQSVRAPEILKCVHTHFDAIEAGFDVAKMHFMDWYNAVIMLGITRDRCVVLHGRAWHNTSVMHWGVKVNPSEKVSYGIAEDNM